MRRHLEGGRLDFDLSRAGERAQVRLENEGYFVATGAAGTYRLEYVYAGQRVEFVVPHTVEIPAEGVACAGTFTLQVQDVTEDLGANSPSTRLEVSDGCAETTAHFEQLAPRQGASAVRLARPAPRLETPLAKPFSESPVGLRIGYGLEEDMSLLRASYVLAWHGELRDWGSALASVSVARQTGSERYELAGAAGFTILPSVELHAGGGVRPVAQTTSPFVYGHLRLDGAVGGLGVRCDLPLREGPPAPVFQLSEEVRPSSRFFVTRPGLYDLGILRISSPRGLFGPYVISRRSDEDPKVRAALIQEVVKGTAWERLLLEPAPGEQKPAQERSRTGRAWCTERSAQDCPFIQAVKPRRPGIW